MTLFRYCGDTVIFNIRVNLTQLKNILCRGPKYFLNYPEHFWPTKWKMMQKKRIFDRDSNRNLRRKIRTKINKGRRKMEKRWAWETARKQSFWVSTVPHAVDHAPMIPPGESDPGRSLSSGRGPQSTLPFISGKRWYSEQTSLVIPAVPGRVDPGHLERLHTRNLQ